MSGSIRVLIGFCALAALILAVLAACMPTAPVAPNGPTPSPTACATVTPSAGATVAAPTQATGRTGPATLMPFPPTDSPEFVATMMARMGTANPGAPTTASGPAPKQTSLPPCWTPTPAR